MAAILDFLKMLKGVATTPVGLLIRTPRGSNSTENNYVPHFSQTTPIFALFAWTTIPRFPTANELFPTRDFVYLYI